MKELSPSILSADFSRLAEQVALTEKGGANFIHVDVMDGHFVPNISFGAQVMKKLINKTKMPFDVHLMIENPDKYLEDFMTDNTEYITVHQEACIHLDRTINHIRNQGAKVGVSINPSTPISALECILPQTDMVLLMSVNPGFGGQKLISYVLEKSRKLYQIRKENNLKFKIEMDGGIGLDNLNQVLSSGVDIIVAGSAIFGAEDITDTTKKFCTILEGEINEVR